MKITDAIKTLDDYVQNPSDGLPDDVFYYISRTTPLANVDLLVKDEIGRTLLSWRDDQYAGTGWHLPGGIIRFKETFEERIRKVAKFEIGVESIEYDSTPLALNQIIVREKKNRAHFISILYKCFLPKNFLPENKGLSINVPGYLKWHSSCPDDLLTFHKIYRKYI